MQQIVLSWFSSSAFANLFGVVILVALLSDEVVPRLAGAKGLSSATGRDRGSFLIRVENRLLLETFGDEYRAYMGRTALLLPPW